MKGILCVIMMMEILLLRISQIILVMLENLFLRIEKNNTLKKYIKTFDFCLVMTIFLIVLLCMCMYVILTISFR